MKKEGLLLFIYFLTVVASDVLALAVVELVHPGLEFWIRYAITTPIAAVVGWWMVQRYRRALR